MTREKQQVPNHVEGSPESFVELAQFVSEETGRLLANFARQSVRFAPELMPTSSPRGDVFGVRVPPVQSLDACIYSCSVGVGADANGLGVPSDGPPLLVPRFGMGCRFSIRRQRGEETVEQSIRLRAFIDLWEMAGVHDDLDADGRNAGAERVEIRRSLTLTHRPTFAPFVAVGGLYSHDWDAQSGQRGGEATDIVTQRIGHQSFAYGSR
jgi:hypothetical protein